MKTAPKVQARLTGALYLTIMVAAMFSEFAVRGALVVSGNAAATAHNILASEPLYRVGGGLDLLTYLCDVAVAALLYTLTKPAGETLALAAAFVRVTYSAMAGTLCFFYFGAVSVLHGAGAQALSDGQIQAAAYSLIKLRSTGFVVALVFFGLHLLLLGGLLIKARYFPTWIGALLLLAGCGYLINSFAQLLYPALSIGPWLLLPGLVGEGALTIWLLAVGVDESKWSAPETGQ